MSSLHDEMMSHAAGALAAAHNVRDQEGNEAMLTVRLPSGIELEVTFSEPEHLRSGFGTDGMSQEKRREAKTVRVYTVDLKDHQPLPIDTRFVMPGGEEWTFGEEDSVYGPVFTVLKLKRKPLATGRTVRKGGDA